MGAHTRHAQSPYQALFQSPGKFICISDQSSYLCGVQVPHFNWIGVIMKNGS